MKKFTLFFMSLFLTIGAMAQFEAGTEYRIKEKSSGKYMSVGGTAYNQYGEVYGADKIDDDSKQIFTFETAKTGTYYLKSNSGEYISYLGTGKGWNVNADASVTNAHELTFEETANIGEYKIKGYNTAKGANKYFKWEYVNASGKYHPFNDSDNGAIFIVEKANAEIFTIVYNYTYNGDVVATYSYDVAEGSAFPELVNIYGVIVSGAKPEGAVSANGEYTFAVTFNMPFKYADSYENISTWYYAVINSTNHNVETGALGDGKYMRAGESDIPANTQSFELGDVDSYSWGFVGNPIDGFKMVSMNGKAIKTNNQATVKAELVDINDGTVFAVKDPKNSVSGREDAFCLLNGANCLNLQSGYVKQWTDTDNGSTLLLTERKEFDVTVGDAGYATLYLDYATYIPTEVEAYTVTNIENGYAKMTQVTGTLPANTGVILKNAGDYTFTTSTVVTSITENLLKGTVINDVITKEDGKEYYILSKQSEGVGLYIAGNGGDNTAFQNAANKAYLVVSKDMAQSASLRFDFGGTTAIEEMTEQRAESKVIFDLTGRRVNDITKAGIYIVNGKKVLVK